MQTERFQASLQDKSKLAFEAVPSHRHYRLRLARYVGLSEAISSYLRERPLVRSEPQRLLDIGPGSGRSLQFLQVAGIDEQLEFYGLENSPRRLKTIHEPSRWKLTLGDAQKDLPYPSEHFDICVCEQVLEHLTQPAEAVDEMVRVLRSDGLMIIGVPIFPPGIAHMRAWAVTHWDRFFGLKRSHVQTFTSRSIIAMVCSDYPLQLVEIRGFRVASGGILSWLEDYKWWYRINRWIGRTFPWLCTEAQLVLHKTNAR